MIPKNMKKKRKLKLNATQTNPQGDEAAAPD